PLAAAQSVEELVDRAVRATTGPKERLETMQELVKREGGDAALAEAGLDPLRDPEVVHMTLEVLLDGGRVNDHVARVCRLLLNESHRPKVEERIYRYAEDLGRARELVGAIAPLARGELPEAKMDPTLQRAAVMALGRIPHRDALDVIIAAWSASKEPSMIATAQQQLKGVVRASTAEEARRYLDSRRYATYTDLMREISEGAIQDRELWRARAERFAEGYFKSASHAEIYEAFANGTSLEKRFAAKRAAALSGAKTYGADGVERFAQELVTCLLKELEERPTEAAGHLAAALASLSRDRALGDKPLPEVAKLRTALTAGARGGADREAFALSALQLLRGMGPPAAPIVADYAGNHGSPAVRTAAVKVLGDLASAGDDATRQRIAEYLTRLLAGDPPDTVRSQILFAMQTAPSPAAIATLRALLVPKDGSKALPASDVSLGVQILAKMRAPEATQLLAELARGAKDPALRRSVIENGLVPRTFRKEEAAEAFALLSSIVLDKSQPADVRKAVLQALGARGYRNASATLGAWAGSDQLELELRKEATLQRLALGERLLAGNGSGQTTPEDLSVIGTMLGEEGLRGAPRPKLLQLARNAVALAARKKIAGGLCRVRYAQLLADEPEAKPAALRAAWKDAVDKAVADGLSDADREQALLAYRKLLAGADAMNASRQLFELANAGNSPARFGYWLDALEVAVEQLQNRGAAEQILQKPPTGEFPTDVRNRREQLFAKLNELPK
ncbi:MAG: HEAT repeat domain-containing protein, partial [Planctomycetota bacterium]